MRRDERREEKRRGDKAECREGEKKNERGKREIREQRRA
jgi:hypothetical protein